MFKGIGASQGIAVGKAKWKKQHVDIDKYRQFSLEQEIEKFQKGICRGEEELQLLINETSRKIGLHEAQIFEAHLMMLRDPEFISQVTARLKAESVTAEFAVKETTEDFVKIFLAIEDAYLRERAADLKDVANRLIRILQNRQEIDFNEAGIILVAEDLTPSDTAKINPEKVVGFITEIGGSTSHSAIMARTSGIPAVVGLGSLEQIKDDDILAFDGETGEVFVNPDPYILEKLMNKKEGLVNEAHRLAAFKGRQTTTRTGKHVELGCNIGRPDDLKYILENDGEGVGLFRSEFLYMDRDTMPTEEEQFIAYKTVLEGMGEKPVVIRTLDIGGDKNIPYFNIPKEENPFLGFRAIRYCLKNEEVFLVQMRALLRAGVYGNLKIMMPMISGLQEVRDAKVLIEQAKEQLRAEQKSFTESYELGIMIEIPSAAICADLLAPEVDFFSIGTNDLIQYTIAVDRMNQDISELYTPYHPAVLRLINNVIQAGHASNIWVGMCGEAAGNPKMIPVLLAMGLDEFSMNPSKILKARELLSKLDETALNQHVSALLNQPDPKAVEAFIEKNFQII